MRYTVCFGCRAECDCRCTPYSRHWLCGECWELWQILPSRLLLPGSPLREVS